MNGASRSPGRALGPSRGPGARTRLRRRGRGAVRHSDWQPPWGRDLGSPAQGRGYPARRTGPRDWQPARRRAGRPARLIARPLATGAVGWAARRRGLAGGGGSAPVIGRRRRRVRGGRRAVCFAGGPGALRRRRRGATGTARARLPPPPPRRHPQRGRRKEAAAARAWECGGSCEPSPSARPPWSRGGDSPVPQRADARRARARRPPRWVRAAVGGERARAASLVAARPGAASRACGGGGGPRRELPAAPGRG